MLTSEEYKKRVLKEVRMIFRDLLCDKCKSRSVMSNAVNFFKITLGVLDNPKQTREVMIKYFEEMNETQMCDERKLALNKTKKGILNVSTE